jgi:hypothetical protein
MSSFIDYMMDEGTAESSMKAMREEMSSKTRSNNLFYYYRKLPFKASSVVRFLPISTEVAESDEVRKRFTLPKKVIRLRFDNPEAAESKVVVAIPVLQMYRGGKTQDDPILRQVTALYDESDKLAKAGRDEQAKLVREKASYHWVRGEQLAQGFVVRSGFVEENVPENPIRVFELNKQIMNRINRVCDPKADPDQALRYWPVHGKLGTNFVITKTESGEWPSYNDSGFSTSGPSPWTDDMKAAIGQHGLWQLESFLPERPGDEEYDMLTEIVRLSISGVTTWDPDWEAHLTAVKPYKTGVDLSSVDPETQTSRVAEALSRVKGTVHERAVVEPTDGNAEDEILATSEEDASQVVGNPHKSSKDVRSLVNQIRQNAKGKTATAAE